MELLEKILSLDPNYLIIGLLVLFFTLEQISSNPFAFKKEANISSRTSYSRSY